MLPAQWQLLETTHLAVIESGKGDAERMVRECDGIWALMSATPALDLTHHRPQRNRLLRSLFRLVDSHPSPRLYVRIARVSLRLATRGGQTMLNTVKLLFKVSKGAGNDAEFVGTGVLPLLVDVVARNARLAAGAVGPFEMLLYAVGAVKNVSQHGPAAKELIKEAAVLPILTEVMFLPTTSSAQRDDTERTSAAAKTLAAPPGMLGFCFF